MAVPLSQMLTVTSYVIAKKLKGVERYPLVLMLEPLFRCNLACAGCGKIQYPEHVLDRRLTPEQCWAAAEECGAPIISIPGGEPLIHPEMAEIVRGLVRRKKFVYLCTNAILLERKMNEYEPSNRLIFSIHMDGLRREHDLAVCRDGVYDVATKAIKSALKRGFRVTTNTTLFNDADPPRVRAFFDEMMDLGVEGMMISPGYSYEKAPDQHGFLKRHRTQELFSDVLAKRKRRWRFNQSPLFLQFLMGKREYQCTPWGNPTYNIFGWQKPCYLLQDGYVSSFKELLETTAWEQYGVGRNEKCQDCMVHCGFEASAVEDTFGSWSGFAGSVKATLFPNTT